MKHFKLKITGDISSLPELASLMTWSPDYCSCDSMSASDNCPDSIGTCSVDTSCEDYGTCPNYENCAGEDYYCGDYGGCYDYAA